MGTKNANESKLMLDVSLAHELKMAFRRNQWSSADIKSLSEKDTLSKVLNFLRDNQSQLKSMSVPIRKHKTECCENLDSVIVNKEDFSGEKHLMNESLRKDVRRVLSYLDETELLVVRYYFGINDDALSVREICDVLHLSEEEVLEIKEKALDHLRNSKICHCVLREYLQ